MNLGRSIALALAPDLRAVLKKSTQARMRVRMALESLERDGHQETLLFEELRLIDETLTETIDLLRGS